MKRSSLAALAGALALAGCTPLTGVSAPPAVARANRTHEYGTPSRPAVGGPGFRSPALAVAAFARGYINWNGATIARHMRGLAAISADQARSAVALLAANTAQDYELRRSGVSNSGTVEAIAPLPSGRGASFVVVSRELTTATGTTLYAGLRPAWHVSLAGVTRTASGGWLVSTWQPES